MAHPTRRMYQRWQANLFRSGWFARTFYETMGRFATPIYEWAYELMAPDIQTAPRIADVGCGKLRGTRPNTALAKLPSSLI